MGIWEIVKFSVLVGLLAVFIGTLLGLFWHWVETKFF